MRLAAERLDRWETSLIVVAVIATGVVVHPGTLSDFQIVKATVLWLSGIVALAGLVVRVVGSPSPPLRRPPALVAAATFVVLLGVAAAFARDPLRAVVGPYARYVGLASYTAAAALFATMVAGGAARAIVAARAVVASGSIVAVYALVQRLGVDPVEWPASEFEGAFSTMGNPNFASAYIAVALVVAVGLALTDRRPRWSRLAMAAVAVATAGLWATASMQGAAAAVAGVVVVIASELTRRSTARERLASFARTKFGLVAITAAVTAVAAGGLVAVLSLGQNALGERASIYDAAARAVADHPWLGVGPGHFGDVFLALRPVRHALQFGTTTTDTAHSVPVEIAATGGVFALVGYLAFVIAVGVAGLRGVLAGVDGDSMVLPAVFGGWVAYQTASFISIDVPALLVTHWVLAGGVVAASSRRVVAGDVARARPKRARTATAPVSVGTAAGWALLVAMLASGWLALRPLRADLAAGRAADRFAAGRGTDGIDALERAVRLHPREATYRFVEGAARERLAQPEVALAAMEAAASLEPGSERYALFAARLAAKVGDEERAIHWFTEAADRDPQNPATLEEAGRFLVDARAAAGEVFLDRAEVLRSTAGS